MSSALSFSQLLDYTSASPWAEVYAQHWTAHGLQTNSPELADIPVMERESLRRAVSNERLHPSGPALVRGAGKPPLFFARNASDIAAEQYGSIGTRPLVLFSDRDEGIEKSLWCYARGVVPYIGDMSVFEVTSQIAMRYRVDTLLCDVPAIDSLLALRPHAIPYTQDITSVVVFSDTSIDATRKAAISTRFPVAECYFRWRLPESGVCAAFSLRDDGAEELCPSDALLECDGGTLTITVFRPLPMPLIRYNTGIACTQTEGGAIMLR